MINSPIRNIAIPTTALITSDAIAAISRVFLIAPLDHTIRRIRPARLSQKATGIAGHAPSAARALLFDFADLALAILSRRDILKGDATPRQILSELRHDA